MSEAAKVIRIELRVRGSTSTGSREGTNNPKEKKIKAKVPSVDSKQKIAAVGVGFLSGLTSIYSQAISIGETLSMNSEESKNLMYVDWNKKAVSGIVLGVSTAIGGAAGAAVGALINKFIVDPLIGDVGALKVIRNMDETRKTNRFYQTNFAGKGTYTFDYSTGGYINEDLDKVRKGSFYKKGSVF